tara:strand:- start:169 stop:420 length:252 start_codon:yes stop_codon:yes gene_type:complete
MTSPLSPETIGTGLDFLAYKRNNAKGLILKDIRKKGLSNLVIVFGRHSTAGLNSGESLDSFTRMGSILILTKKVRMERISLNV